MNGAPGGRGSCSHRWFELEEEHGGLAPVMSGWGNCVIGESLHV